MMEPIRGISYLVQTLNVSAFTSVCIGGIWRGAAPNGTAYPVCIVQYQAGLDVTGSNQTRLWVDGTYIVKVAGPADTVGTLASAMDIADGLLQKSSGTSEGGTIMTCVREKPYQLDEIVDGQRFTNLGGFYRLLIHS